MNTFTEHPEYFSAIRKNAKIGFWSAELKEDRTLRVFFDEAALALLGIPDTLSPEETYLFWREHIHKESLPAFNTVKKKLLSGEAAEAEYLWHHPDGTLPLIRGSAMPNPDIKDGHFFCGAFQLISDAFCSQFQSKYDEFSVFSAFLLSAYATACYVDLRNGKYRISKLADRISSEYSIGDDCYELLKAYIERDVYPSDANLLRVLLDPQKIREQLRDQLSFSIRYRFFIGQDLNYARCDVMQATDEDHIALGFANITKEVHEQHKDLLGAIPLSPDILDKAHIGLWAFELDEGEAPRMYVDDTMLGLIGLDHQVSPEETYHAWYDRIDPASYGLVAESVEKMVSGEHAEVQYPWHHPDGRTMIVRCGGVRNPKYTEGIRIEGTHQDVTETLHFDESERKRQKEIEHILATQARRMKSFGNMVNSALWDLLINDDNEIIEVNWSEEFRHLLGYENEADFPNTINSWSSRLHPEDQERALTNLNQSIRSRNFDDFVYDIDYRVLRKTGEACWYHAVGRMESLENGLRRMYGIFYDISKDKELEKQRQRLHVALSASEAANRAKTVFLNNMSHDIRTPMNAIIGYTKLAENHIDNKSQVKDYLAKISQSSDHLLSLINDVLDMSRIESGKMSITEKEENLSDLIHALRNIVQGDIQSKQLGFSMDVFDVRDENILCDRLRLNQVLLNILSNAIKYTPADGKVSVRVTEKAVNTNGTATFEFVVKDNGIGMSEDFLKKIFDPFTRENSTTISGIQGTGLGMAITKNIVDMMGGTIRIESALEQGTEVTICFDFKLQEAPSSFEALPSFENVRTMVVHGDPQICDSIAKTVRRFGMKDDVCYGGKETMTRAKEALEADSPYGLYIIDWLVSGMNGIEITRKLRKDIGDDTPIILLTDFDWSDIEKEATSAGVTAFIHKPMFPSDLCRVLQDHCTGKAAEADGAPEEPIDFTGKKVLLVEDNEINCEIATDILEEAGFIVSSAEDGDIAVEIMKNAKPGDFDLILMDIQMPRMNGYDATKAIRKLYPIEELPIIALSANAFAEDKAASILSGMNDHIAKPIRLEELFGALARYLK